MRIDISNILSHLIPFIIIFICVRVFIGLFHKKFWFEKSVVSLHTPPSTAYIVGYYYLMLLISLIIYKLICLIKSGELIIQW